MSAELLGESTWTEIRELPRRIVVVPVGSMEQHGPHLPLDTDLRIANAVAVRGADPSTTIAAPICYGASGEHAGFPGTLSIGHEALRSVLIELGRSARNWADRLLFVNGHGGNMPTVPAAVAQLRAEGSDAAWFACGLAGSDAHAGHAETSMMLALEPALVRTAAMAAGNAAPIDELMPALVARGVMAVSPNGVLGDPRTANAEHGEILLAELVAAYRARLARWQPDEQGLLR